jgi:hypothetical protein
VSDQGGLSSLPGVSKPARTLTESLLSIVLVLEAILVFFVTLAVYGLKALEPAPAFIGGAVLIGALILTSRTVRYRWGVWLGWGMQAVLLATGILLPVMYFIAAGFIAIWIYCFVKGKQIDAANFGTTTKETP